MDHRVLVPFDGSDPAREALELALDRFSDGEIIALHVIDLGTSTQGLTGGADDAEERAREDAEERLEEARTRAEERGTSIRTAIEQGTPERAIAEYAEENDVDHVVIGSHSRSGVSRILLGSVAEDVVKRAPVSVTVVR